MEETLLPYFVCSRKIFVINKRIELEDYDGELGSKDENFFIGDLNSSEGEEEINLSHLKLHSIGKRAARLGRETSPPLLLTYNITSGRALGNQSPTSTSDSLHEEEEEEEEEDESDHPIEKWMLLGGEEQVGDSSIQLNLSYNNCSEEEDQTVKETWAVSDKDKPGADHSLPRRYFTADRSLFCNICNKTGHLAKSCYSQKKCTTCVLCGIQGHVQRHCGGRPCPSCGLPSHGRRPCERPQVWNQHCQRCGMPGHLSDTCPDTWRQYHLTIGLELPVRPWTDHILKNKKFSAHCYNCSKRGHHGYECTKTRMVSGTFALLPYVCHYDTIDDVLQCCSRKQKRAKELLSAGPLRSDQQHLSEATGGCWEGIQPVQGRSRMHQETFGRASRRKKWPETRRERQELKRLRKDAQARREGGLLNRSGRYFDDKVSPADLPRHKQYTPPPKKKNEAGGKSRKSREAERWKKRGGLKRGYLYPHGDIDTGSERLLSPKHRVRHRKR
ncbi:zinc finger CCHC domain-containing protein 7-like isoform X2 [Pungitius pungitius]|uniref:zinc finger CCHC domain-containing protein 7-like isoform X2 n=1 Tax=Pungitius pungitius TaxID=134920 RepID=UPI002E1367C3